MQHNPVFQQTGALRPGKSAFDLSHVKIFDANIGALVPVYVEDVVPGDVIDLSHVHVIRSQPLVTPIYHRLEVFSHTFFVPYRILFRDMEKFLTRGASGDEVVVLPKFGEAQFSDQVTLHRYGLWDMFGLPIHNPLTGSPEDSHSFAFTPPVHDLFWRAYWVIWRDYYRDSNHQVNYPNNTPEAITVPVPVGESPDELQDQLDAWMEKGTDDGNYIPCDMLAYRCWSKDYFTSALPWQQRGTAPAIPISGQTSAYFDPNDFLDSYPTPPLTGYELQFSDASPVSPPVKAYAGTANSLNQAAAWFNQNVVTALTTGVSVADLRATIQTQKWMERNARGGYRYNEFLASHFGVAPRDERLQRPEYLGGSRNPVIISEVLQNSSTDVTSPQGNMSGHAMAVDQAYHARYRVLEHGVIMTVMSIMPEAIYQTGIPRMFSRETTFDFYSPEFAHLSEAEIKKKEIYFNDDGGTVDDARFGFQAAWDEYRDRQSMVCGKMASSLNVWHLSRLFDSCPSLNENFLTTKEFSETRRTSWAVPGVVANTQGQFLCQWRNIVKAIRPLPYISDPGLLDHF